MYSRSKLSVTSALYINILLQLRPQKCLAPLYGFSTIPEATTQREYTIVMLRW